MTRPADTPATAPERPDEPATPPRPPRELTTHTASPRELTTHTASPRELATHTTAPREPATGAAASDRRDASAPGSAKARSDRRPRRRLEPGERREQILAAASDAFADRRYADVTVAEVAVAAQASEALVYRYFPTKAELYTALVARAVDELVRRQRDAVAQLASGVPVRDRLRAAALVYLDHVAAHPVGWSAPLRGDGGDPPAAVEARRAARSDYVARLRAELSDRPDLRHDYALWGYFGFLDAACLRWVDQGCPSDHRWSLVDAALGSLEGALGDWDA